jgi:iron complex outermembrane recepter protein
MEKRQEKMELEEVQVTGIRGAIVQGLESKRDADGIIETIRSEDIGKLPDASLAESLQRVPGIAIDRDGGEGRYVSIRGFGPSYNTVLFNGRRIASSETDRSFGFDTIASDLIGGVDVYKTHEAFLREGGIGGTVDIRTLRPLDRPGLQVTARGEVNYEDNSGRTTPKAALVMSDTFMNNALGVQLSLSYQKRENRTYNAGGEENGLRSLNSFTALNDNPNTPSLNFPFTYSNFGLASAYRLQEFDRNVIDETRTRKGAYADIQYKLNEDLEFNVDYLYSDFKTVSDLKQVGNFFFELEPPASVAPTIAAYRNQDPVAYANAANYAAYIAANSSTMVDSNGVLIRASSVPDRASQAFNGEINQRPTNTQMIGVNMKWRLADKLALTVDAAYSTADLDNYGANQNLRRSLENLNAGSFLYQTDPSGMPYLTNLSPTLTASMSNTDHLYFRSQWDSGTRVSATNKEASLQFDYKATDSLKFRFGSLEEIGDKASADYFTPLDVVHLWADFTPAGSPLTPAQLQQIASAVYSSNPSNFGLPANSDNNTFLFNYPGVIAFATDPANLQALLNANASLATTDPTRYAALVSSLADFKQRIANNPADPYYAVPTGAGYSVQEKVTSVYFDTTKRFRLFGSSSILTAGLRYTRTHTKSAGYTQVLTGLAADPLDPTRQGLIPSYANPNGPGGLTYYTEEHSYFNWLPTLGLKVNVTNDIVARVAASKTLTRPPLSYLAPSFAFNVLTVGSRTATTNNPSLKPLTSTNLDVGAEWYYGSGDALSVDAFWKKVDGFITSQVVSNVVIPTVQPSVYDTFSVTEPTNAQAVKVYGGTAGWTHSFDFGFGFQANYTRSDTNRPFNAATYSATKVALPGVSDEANVVLFYERGPLAARVAYNWRSKFLSRADFPGGQYGSLLEPLFTQAYHQIDARIGFGFLKHYQVYLEGVNLENSTPVKVGRFDNLFISNLNYGRRFILGVSGKL